MQSITFIHILEIETFSLEEIKIGKKRNFDGKKMAFFLFISDLYLDV